MMCAATVSRISPSDFLGALRNLRSELGVLDVREEGIFAQGHILLASSLPLSQLEMDAPRIVPRRSASIILCDDADGLSEIAQTRLRSMGYTDVAILDGGMPAWLAAGFEVFSGLNAPSKALGVFVAKELSIPEIGPDELSKIQKRGENIRVIDCRPFAEYQRGSIPGAVNAPGVELLRGSAGGRSQLPLVITCAGRTRGLLGAQTLIDAGVAGPVTALHKGTMGWELSGRALEKNAVRKFEGLPERQRAPAEIAQHIRDSAGVTLVDLKSLERWVKDKARTTYVFDIRTRGEFEAGHYPGACHVAGGQLVQNLDQHAAVQGARIVLTDDDGVRATGVGLWLRRMGWADVAIAPLTNESQLEAGGGQPVSVQAPQHTSYIGAEELSKRLKENNILLIDLASSRTYRAGHIPGAHFAIRSRLANTLPKLAQARTLVMTSEEGTQAAFACSDGFAFDGEVLALSGGTQAWVAAGYALASSADGFAEAPDDVMLKPSELTEGREDAMRDYLSGSDDLLEKVERDGTLHLAALPIVQQRDI